jgi:hypothetical protein
MSSITLSMQWDGEGFVPAKKHHNWCNANLVAGQFYDVTLIEQRSAKQHARYFAMVKEYFHTLPESRAGDFPSEDHLRKHALIRTGYCKERKIVCADDRQALEMALLAKDLDSYCIASVEGRVCTVWTAETQNMRAMDKARFKASSDAVLTWIETEILGVHEVAA